MSRFLWRESWRAVVRPTTPALEEKCEGHCGCEGARKGMVG